MSASVAGTVSSNASTIQTTVSGRGGGRGNSNTSGSQNQSTNSAGRGRTNRSGNRNNRIRNGNPNTPRGLFKGSTAGMNGHVFESYEERGDRTQFPKTLEALGEYAAKNLKFPEDLRSMFSESMSAPHIPDVPDIDEFESTKKEMTLWEAALKSYTRRSEALTSNLTTLYSVIWGQCSEAMRNKIKSIDDFVFKNGANNCIWLLNNIKGVTHQFDTKRNIFLSLLDARKHFYSCKQSPQQTNSEYLDVFNSNVNVLEYYKASVGESYLLVDDEHGTLDIPARKKIARDMSIAMAFLAGADPARYNSLRSDLANQQIRGNDQYPKDMTSAYSLLVNYHGPTTSRNGHQNLTNNDPKPNPTTTEHPTIPSNIGPHTFVQSATVSATPNIITGTDGATHSGITCFSCNANGHYASSCPSAVSLVQYAVTLTQVTTGEQQSFGSIPKHWILLDSQSSISVFNNPHMLTDIRVSPQHIVVKTNGGIQTSTLIGNLKNLGQVWYNPDSIANILSLADVSRVCRVTMDTNVTPEMVVHKLDGTTMRFKQHNGGLYIYDPHDTQHHCTSHAPCTLLQTVFSNKVRFSNREIESADLARDLYRKLGRPSQQRFEDIIKKNFIRNCPITVDDARRALIIYGPDIASVKGKTVTGKPTEHVPNFKSVDIPAPILQDHRDVTLCMDFFYVQGQIFYHEKSNIV